MSEIREYKNITSEADADELIADFESEGCTVNKILQDDGKWTVKAICPDD